MRREVTGGSIGRFSARCWCLRAPACRVRGLRERSPRARVHDIDDDLPSLGTSHATSTSLHLAEHRADLGLDTVTHAGTALVDGEREWVQWTDVDLIDEWVPDRGATFGREHPDPFETGRVGVGDAKLLV